MMFRTVMAHIHKDLIVNFRSLFSFFIISFWIFLSFIVSFYVLSGNEKLTFSNLLIYKFFESMTNVSVLIFLIPAIFIPLEYESGMINIYKGLNLSFNVIFISKLVSIIINLLILEIISIIVFIIVYVSLNINNLNTSLIVDSIPAELIAVLFLTFVFIPAIGLISMISYASSRRWISILFSTLLFISLLISTHNIASVYDSSATNIDSAIFSLPSIYYPLFISFPYFSIGIMAEVFGFPIINRHSLSNGVSIGAPLFHAFLNEVGYITWISIFGFLFLFLSYIIGRVRYYYG